MSMLLRVIRATHCRSTHHYFALDSLCYVDTPAGCRLRDVLLKHHEKYLAGATDPDDRFRDFQNHCVYVRDGYWGGAPRLALAWYERLKGYLVAQRYDDAAYAAGVLSHYFTDPLQPLHTAQTPREPLVHRAMEWSVRCCYDEILQLWTDDDFRIVFQLGDREGWLAEAIFKGARFANRSYDRLVQSYDLERGTIDPKAGLDAAARQTFAELFGLAITGLARIWERVAEEACALRQQPLPVIALTPQTLLATLQVPEKLLIRAIVNRRERGALAGILAEFQQTGKLVDRLPSECYVKQQVWLVRQREVAWRDQRQQLQPATPADGITRVDQPAAAGPVPRPCIVTLSAQTHQHPSGTHVRP